MTQRHVKIQQFRAPKPPFKRMAKSAPRSGGSDRDQSLWRGGGSKGRAGYGPIKVRQPRKGDFVR